MDSLQELLRGLELERLVELYSESQDSDNTNNEDLLWLYNHEMEYVYGVNSLKSLDYIQIAWLNEQLEKAILYVI